MRRPRSLDRWLRVPTATPVSRSRRRWAKAIAAALLATAPAGPGAAAGGDLPDDATLVARGAVVGRVELDIGEIFDPERPAENRRLFRLANRLHVRTREAVIRRKLLFRSGDRYDPRLLAESERLLRAERYLYDARIRPVAWDGQRVDVEVETRDVWTLTAGVHFSRSGGANKTQLELQDFNFLGTGKDVTLNHTSAVDRDSTFARYRDPELLGTRGELEAILSENSDGHLRRLELARPFYELDARWAAGLTLRSEDRIDPLYTLGRVRERFRHRLDEAAVWWGRSPGLGGGRRVWRFRVGATFDRDRFTPAPDREPPAILPEDRTLVYPWVGVERLEDRYIELRDLDQLARTEDANLGDHFALRLGWASPAFGADRSAAVFEADAARRLDRDSQLLLGGDGGLRGYPLRFQEGNRRALLTVEQRFFFPWHVLRLVHLGAAVFFDAGQAWFSGLDRSDELGLLRDVGVGLRVASSRSGQGTIVHLDVAYPLDGPNSRRTLQWSVSTQEGF